MSLNHLLIRTFYVLILSLLISNSLSAQDSVYYSVLWTPTSVYKNAKVFQEDVSVFQTSGQGLKDSVLTQRIFYDSMGRVVKQENYSSAELSNRIQNFYSLYLDSSIEEGYSTNKIVHTYYHYDTNGNLVTKQAVITPGADISWRYVYNESNQLRYIFQQVEGKKEFLGASYNYQPDRLIKSIVYYSEGGKEQFSYRYLYKSKKEQVITTRLLQRPGGSPEIDNIRTYNEKKELCRRETNFMEQSINANRAAFVQTVNVEEVFTYFSTGLLKEKVTKKDDEVVRIEKHIYQ